MKVVKKKLRLGCGWEKIRVFLPIFFESLVIFQFSSCYPSVVFWTIAFEMDKVLLLTFTDFFMVDYGIDKEFFNPIDVNGLVIVRGLKTRMGFG